MFKYVYFLSINGTYLDSKREDTLNINQLHQAFAVNIFGTNNHTYSEFIYMGANTKLIGFIYLHMVAMEAKVAENDFHALENIIGNSLKAADSGN